MIEVSVLRKSGENCFGSNNDSIPYCNGIFAQNSIKLAMRKYDKLGIKSGSDADLGYIISERASAEPPSPTETENLNAEYSDNHACTTTTFVKMESDTSKNETSKSSNKTDSFEPIKTYRATLMRPKIGEIEARINEINDKNNSDASTQSGKTPIGNNVAITSSYKDDNWIFYGKKETNEANVLSGKFPPTSSIMLNNEISSNDTEQEKTKNLVRKNDLNLSMNQSDNNLANNATSQQADGNYFFTEDGTLRTLTSSSYHSDRSMVQLNLVCCEIDSSKVSDHEKGSSRISEEEEENDVNKTLINVDSIATNQKPKSLLDKNSMALKSFSHLPSSSITCDASNKEFQNNAACDENELSKLYVNTCNIQLMNVSRKDENSSKCSEKAAENSIVVKNQQMSDDKVIQKVLPNDGVKSKESEFERKTQENELSTILQNMIEEIEEHSKNPSRDEEDNQEKKSNENKASIQSNNYDNIRKNINESLLEKLNSRAIGTIIYENIVDLSASKQGATKKQDSNALKIETTKTEDESKVASKSGNYQIKRKLKKSFFFRFTYLTNFLSIIIV